MKKVLFTIQWFPSVLSANALCDETIIEAIRENNEYDISCLVYNMPGMMRHEKIKNIKVNRFCKGLLWDLVIKAKQNPGRQTSKIVLILNRIIQRVKQILLILIYPVFEPVAIYKFCENAKKLFEQEGFDVVISEHNGLDTLIAGYYLKKKYPKIKYIPIFWDPLYGKEPAKYLPKSYSVKKQRKLERKIMEAADKAVFMDSLKDFHLKNQVDYGEKAVYLSIPKIVKPNIIMESDEYTISGMINIVYSGILNIPDRDPEPFLKIISQSRHAKNINLIFFCTGKGREIIEKYKDVFPGNIVLSPYISPQKLKAVYKNASILINFGGPNPNMVPSKIFDYMSFCKPLISTYYIDNEASKHYLVRYPIALLLDQRNRIEENTNSLDDFIDHLNEKEISFDQVESSFILNSPKCYVSLLQEVLSN